MWCSARAFGFWSARRAAFELAPRLLATRCAPERSYLVSIRISSTLSRQADSRPACTFEAAQIRCRPSRATGHRHLAGGFQSRAVYRDGFGCIILHGDESKVAATGKFPGGEIGRCQRRTKKDRSKSNHLSPSSKRRSIAIHRTESATLSPGQSDRHSAQRQTLSRNATLLVTVLTRRFWDNSLAKSVTTRLSEFSCARRNWQLNSGHPSPNGTILPTLVTELRLISFCA